MKYSWKSEVELVGNSMQFTELMDLAQRLSDLDTHVLILGETGTGKTAIARHIHDLHRGDKPFVRVDCTQLRGERAESVLFGHMKGAFTGAYKDEDGKLASAKDGTVFLDEIGEMDVPLQAQLLAVLDSKEFCQMGGKKTIKLRARVIAGTNVDLESHLSSNRFRRDLSSRLSHKLIIPPLRDRKDDIPALFMAFWKKHFFQYGFKLEDEKDSELLALASKLPTLHYDWLDNAREVENLMVEAMLRGRPNLKHFIECFQRKMMEAMQKSCQNSQVLVQEVLANHIGLQLSSLLTSKCTDNLNERLQSLLANSLEDALQALMESGESLKSRSCSAIGHILGHKNLATATGKDAFNSKSAQYKFVETAFVQLYMRHSGTDHLRNFLGNDLLQVVGREANRNSPSSPSAHDLT